MTKTRLGKPWAGSSRPVRHGPGEAAPRVRQPPGARALRVRRRLSDHAHQDSGTDRGARDRPARTDGLGRARRHLPRRRPDAAAPRGTGAGVAVPGPRGDPAGSAVRVGPHPAGAWTAPVGRRGRPGRAVAGRGGLRVAVGGAVAVRGRARGPVRHRRAGRPDLRVASHPARARTAPGVPLTAHPCRTGRRRRHGVGTHRSLRLAGGRRVAVRAGAARARPRPAREVPGRRAVGLGVPGTAHPARPRHRVAGRRGGERRRRGGPGAGHSRRPAGHDGARHPCEVVLAAGPRPGRPGGRRRDRCRLAYCRVSLAGRRPCSRLAGVAPHRRPGGLDLPHRVHASRALRTQHGLGPGQTCCRRGGTRGPRCPAHRTRDRASGPPRRMAGTGRRGPGPRAPGTGGPLARTLGSTTTVPSAAPEPEISLRKQG